MSFFQLPINPKKLKPIQLLSYFARIRSEAVLNMPKEFRIVQDHESAQAGDLQYIYDETFQEDKGKAKTWQPVSVVTTNTFERHKSRIPISRGADYFCLIRPVSKSAGLMRRLRWWFYLKKERAWARYYQKLEIE